MKPPSGDPSDFCVAHRAESVLFMPEIAKSASTPKRSQHMSTFSIFEVGFIRGIVRVGFAFDLDVSLDGSALGVVQPDFIWPSLVIADFTEEGPVAIPTSLKVFQFEPVWVFVRVPSSCPLPQTGEDGVIDAAERAFTHHMPVIVSPTTDHRVERIDQIGGRHAKRGFDSLPDAIQEGFDILAGRLDEQFPIGISAHILSEKIKAVLHVRNDSLRGREFKPSFLQELLYEGLDLFF
jgi:hypothetical protein